MTKEEKWVAEICWGGVPVDHKWIKECPKWIEEMKNFREGKWDELYSLTKDL